MLVDVTDGAFWLRSPANAAVGRQFFNFARPSKDGNELVHCPTESCNGMGHVSGNYATHRRQASRSVDAFREICVGTSWNLFASKLNTRFMPNKYVFRTKLFSI